MELSGYLAKVIGVYLLVISAYLMFNQKNFEKVAKDLVKSPGISFLLGVIDIIAGLLIVLVHNIWVVNWQVLITLIGYLSLAKGLHRLFFPETANYFLKNYQKIWVFSLMVGTSLLLGAILSFYGFFS